MKQGQITPESPLGAFLTRQASKATTIMEIGAWNGLGSTACLIAGMNQNNPKLLTLEADSAMHAKAHENLVPWIDAYKVTLLQCVVAQQIVPYWHPVNSVQDRETWEHELFLIQRLPRLFQKDEWHGFIAIKKEIDLLVLDGGEFTSVGDFLSLWGWARVIVLDDTNPAQTVKNVFARDWLIKAGWEVLADNLNDRHGWFAARRKE